MRGWTVRTNWRLSRSSSWSKDFSRCRQSKTRAVEINRKIQRTLRFAAARRSSSESDEMTMTSSFATVRGLGLSWAGESGVEMDADAGTGCGGTVRLRVGRRASVVVVVATLLADAAGIAVLASTLEVERSATRRVPLIIDVVVEEQVCGRA